MPNHSGIASLVSNVTASMIDMTFAVSNAALTETLYERICVLPTWGPHKLTIAVACDNASCLKIAGAMFGMEEDELDDELIRDAISEIANMTAGQIKPAVAPQQELGLPTIVDAETFLRVADDTWHKFVLSTEDTNLVVCIADDNSTPAAFVAPKKSASA